VSAIDRQNLCDTLHDSILLPSEHKRLRVSFGKRIGQSLHARSHFSRRSVFSMTPLCTRQASIVDPNRLSRGLSGQIGECFVKYSGSGFGRS